tara:strand:- start:1809 stop:2987 length:1179 start_codon:yes stop_codon:yes gene_type:complete
MRGLLKILFIITLLELFLGGGGRVFEIGPVTLRMLLFVLNFIVAGVLYLERGSIPIYVVSLIMVVSGALLFYTALGWLNGASLVLIAEDVKPLSYFYSILFISYYIDNVARVQLVISLIKRSSLFLALVYIFIQALFFLGRLDFMWFYNYALNQVSPSDFFFRGTQGFFFYKGFLYMVVGLIFWIHSSSSRWRGLAILIIMTAMILTGTRGFILMFGLLYAFFYGIPMLLKLNMKMLILAVVLLFGSIYFFGKFEIGDKVSSDSIRVQQLLQVIERIDPISFFIGHGFGIGVPVREVHMEIGYLEVFHKQGVLGLCIWTLLFIILYNAYVGGNNHKGIRKSFFLGALLVIMLSFTNPFFNNPIGISLFMIALSCMYVLNREGNMEMSTNQSE